MHYVYLLKAIGRNDRIYIGQTSDLERRLEQHNNNLNSSTAHKGPWEIVYFEAYKNPKDALEREKMLKQYGTSLSHLKKRIQHSLD